MDNDTVDTGEWGARKKAPSSEQEKQQAFDNFRKKLKEFLGENNNDVFRVQK